MAHKIIVAALVALLIVVAWFALQRQARGATPLHWLVGLGALARSAAPRPPCVPADSADEPIRGRLPPPVAPADVARAALLLEAPGAAWDFEPPARAIAGVAADAADAADAAAWTADCVRSADGVDAGGPVLGAPYLQTCDAVPPAPYALFLPDHEPLE